MTAYFTGQFIYSILFACLTISSLFVHSYHTLTTNLIDKFFIGCIVLFGGYTLYKKRTTSHPIAIFFCVLTFLFCIMVYIYGFFTNQFCFHPDCDVGNQFHACMHIVGSIGHHAIILL
jgi:hypothetical protein